MYTQVPARTCPWAHDVRRHARLHHALGVVYEGGVALGVVARGVHGGVHALADLIGRHALRG